ncbi:MAG: glycerophosphodiester phosphodiesterase [Patescibacteria group bacterium]
MPSKPLIIAHRGVSSLEIENTMPAFRRAVEIGAPMLEFDVQQTKDKKLVICHDFNLKRLGGVDIDIDKMSFDELREIKIKNPEISEEKTGSIPTLEDFLKEFVGKIDFNLEIKSVSGHVFTEIDQLLNLLDFYKAQNSVSISSFDFGIMQKINALRSDLKLAVLASGSDLRWWNRCFDERRAIRKALSVKAVNLHFPVKKLRKNFINKIHEAGLKAFTYTVYPGKDFEKCLECGVDGIFTNHPQEFIDPVK